MRIYGFFLCFFFCLTKGFAQADFHKKMELYAKVKSTGIFFVHFDKNVYTNSETAYFTGYLLKPARVPINQHKVMSVALIRDIDSALVLEDKFAMENGIAFGSIKLPDSIIMGNYHFMVYTEQVINGKPDVLFRQNITLKSTLDPVFRSQIKLMSPQPDEQQNYQVLINATSAEGRFLPKPVQVEYRYGSLKKSIKTDASGQALLLLPAGTHPVDPKVYVKLKYNKDSSFISLNLPQPKIKASVKFYPEGGNMVNGLISTVGWEVKDAQNQPLALKALLYKNQQVIDTVESSSYGIGRFPLKPEAGVKYSLKLIHSALADSIYLLPPALPAGITLSVPYPLAGDTLIVQLRSLEKQAVTLLVHNFDTCFINASYPIESKVLRMKIALDDVPKGLTTLTLLDSLNRPLAERIFFAHYQPDEKITVGADQSSFKKREKVNLKLSLKEGSDALVSVAVTQKNRHEHQKMTDIESYTYITDQLNALPVVNSGRPYSNTDYLSQILLVKGWRRYLWPEMLNTNPNDTLYTQRQLKINGQVDHKKTRIPPVEIGALGSQSFQVFKTDDRGQIIFNADDLITPPDKKMYLFVNGVQAQMIPPKIRVEDDFSALNAQLATLKAEGAAVIPSALVNNALLVIPNNEKILRLKEVVIKGKNSQVSGSGKGTNACGEYVCMNKILNCRNHINDPANTLPIKGMVYIIDGRRQLYTGCNPLDHNIFTLIKSAHQHKEFYIDDYKDPNEPAFFSTLYWNYGTLLKAGNPVELSFYTSDIAGKFRIIVQGASNKDVIYGETAFEVKDK